MSTVEERTRRGGAAGGDAGPIDASAAYRPPYGAAGLATLAVFALYALTLAPTTAFWDTSEYIATAHMLGIPHPPGNPLFVILARAWELLLAPFGLSVAVRINLFSATMGALAHGCWFLIAHRILSFFSEARWFRLTGAAVAVLISATAFTVWNQSNVNEKVYTVSLFTIALLSWLAFRWRDRLGEGKDDNLLLLMIFILALSVGNHLMAFLVAPALIVFILLVHPSTLLNWRLYGTGVLAGIVGLSVHLFLPLRAGLSPVINEADPTCESIGGALQSIVTMGRTGCVELSDALSRKQYDKPPVTANPIVYPDLQPRDAHLFSRQVLNYVQYFDWQWARAVAGNLSWYGGFRPMFTLLFTLLGLIGAWTHWQRDRTSFAYVGVLFATLSLGLVFYLNFRYGYTLPESLMRRDLVTAAGGAREITEVRERDYFFIVSFSIWGLWAGIGLAALWQDLTARFTVRRAGSAPLFASPILAIALIPLAFNWAWASRSGDYTARDWSYNLLMSLEPYAIVFTNGDNDTFPLWYLQEVEGIRRDVTVMVMSYLNTPWYVRQIKQLTEPCAPGVDPLADPTRIVCQRPFEPDKAPPFYGEAMIPADVAGQPAEEIPPGRRLPTRSIMPLTEDEIRQIANTPPYLLSEDRVYTAGNIRTTLPRNSVIIPSDLFLATMIQASIGDRPVYFAMTTQAYEELALRPYLIRQGVAFKLNNGPIVADTARGILPTPQGQVGAFIGPWVDLPRTEMLTSEIFQHRGGFPDEWGHWVDSATEGIPFYYGYTHFGLAEVYASIGEQEKSQEHVRRAEAFFRLGSVREQAARR